jgi:hypothetical protein
MDPCLYNVIYTINDLAFLYNNVSDTTFRTLEGPLFNITGLLSRNAQALPNCYLFANQSYYFIAISYAYFDNMTVFLESFVFGMLGNTMKIKNIFD